MKGNKSIRGSTDWWQEFIDKFRQLSNQHHPWQVWQDFVHMSACAIANAVDRRPDIWRAREDSYLAAIKKYSKEEQDLICELFGIAISALEDDPAQDFLGEIYKLLNLSGKWHGQVFTPWPVSTLMAKMLIGEHTKEEVAAKGYITVHDPCCGAGCMLMAFAKVCKDDLDINYQQSALFVAQDIDPVVAKMCYIQISLIGCPGYVVIGNSLTEPVSGNAIEPVYSKPENIWYTPLYFTDIWTLRRIRSWNPPPKEENDQEDQEKPQEPKPDEVPKELIAKQTHMAPTMRKAPPIPAIKKPVTKKPFSLKLKEFFTVKGRDKK